MTDRNDRSTGREAETPNVDPRGGTPAGQKAASAPDAAFGETHHTGSAPTGSARAAVETPDGPKSRKLLIGAALAVIVIIALMFLIPTAAEATPALFAVTGDV